MAVVLLGFALSVTACKDSGEDSTTEEDGSGTVASGAQPDVDPSAGTAGVATDADRAAVAEAKASLVFSAIAGGNPDPDHVTAALVLPTAHENGTTIAWTSGDPAVLANDGAVTRPAFGANSTNIVLNASLAHGQAFDGVMFSLQVLEAEPTAAQATDVVNATYDQLTEAVLLGNNASLTQVKSNLTLPVSASHGVTITWASTNTSVATDGTVSRPPYTASHASGTLTATIARAGVSRQKSFTVRVLRLLPSLMITEVHAAGFIDDGWVEITNTGGAAVDLSTYGWRACDNTWACTGTATGALPAVTLQPGAYLLIHPQTGDPGDQVNGKTDVYANGLYLLDRSAFFELTRAGASVDFVRWNNNSYNNTRSPLGTGGFSGTVLQAANPGGNSLGRKFPYDDTDSSADFTLFARATPGGPNSMGTADGVDTDGDGLSDAYEINISHTDPTKIDTDGDWFTDGEEVLDTGFSGLSLKALGADPLVRDVFVELDYMASPAGAGNSLTDSTGNAYGLPLRKAALDKVKAVFDSYFPDGNDPNQYQIRIHFDVGDLFDHAPGLNPASYDLGGGNQVPFARCLFLGVDAYHDATNCANLYAVKQDNFDAARRNVFHYFVIGWSQQANGAAGSSGRAELPGNDGVITVGNVGGNALSETYIVNIQAATILHELGHNLGLHHGGDVEDNYKPNYVSSMNYLYQLQGLDDDDNGDVYYASIPGHPLGGPLDHPTNGTALKIGYSKGGRLNLNEASLSEPNGWKGVAIDFDGNGTKTSTGLAFNLQPSTENTTLTVLSDYDDWAQLNLAFQTQTSSSWNGAQLRPAVRSRAELVPGPVATDQQPRGPACLNAPVIQ